MAVTIKTRALKEGFVLEEVHPAYTSIIGKLKYKDTYGLSDHQAAAFVIGRRALGYTEKIPKALKKIALRADLYFKSCQWKDKTWRSIAKWLPLWSAVKKKLTHFFKTKNYKRLLGSVFRTRYGVMLHKSIHPILYRLRYCGYRACESYTALQYVLFLQYCINLGASSEDG